jgi:hypothetical protein
MDAGRMKFRRGLSLFRGGFSLGGGRISRQISGGSTRLTAEGGKIARILSQSPFPGMHT